MRFGTVMTAAVLASVLGASAGRAEMRINGPSEVPPSSYTGRQYVDSAGCVFVRAGYGNVVNWVPRVGRNKAQLCGYKPTFQKGEAVLDVARVAPDAPAAKAPQSAPAAAPVVAASAKPAPAAAVRVASAKPVSPFASTPFAGRPMPTIALTTTPPQIGRAAAQPSQAATALPKAAMPAAAPALTARSGYASPFVAGATAPASAVKYHNTTPLPGGMEPARIISSEAVAVAGTSCPAGTASAQRYILSDGRRVVRCGGQASDPASFINNAAVPGLVVAAAPNGYVSPYVAGSVAASAGPRPANPAPAPLYGGTGYAVSPAQMPVSGASSAPLLGGAGYSVAPFYNTAPMATSNPMVGGAGYVLGQVGAAAAGMTPQQAYAAASPYQATPSAVTLRMPGGHTTLAPVLVSTKTGPSGYSAAFEDGRLNPYRGPRSYWGDVEQGEIWTNEVPARRVTAQTPDRKRIVPVQTAPVVRMSSKSMGVPAPAPQPVAMGRYVQVGSFAVAENAAAAKARLAAAGLPVATSTTRKGLVVVMAGPFANPSQALGAVRGAGFHDAIVR